MPPYSSCEDHRQHVPMDNGWPRSLISAGIESLVRKKGLEPLRPFGHQLLRLARLPIPPLPRRNEVYIIATKAVLRLRLLALATFDRLRRNTSLPAEGTPWHIAQNAGQPSWTILPFAPHAERLRA